MGESRREALARLAKATVTTSVGSGGLLTPQQSKAFLEVAQDSSDFGNQIRTEYAQTVSGTINKLATGKRLLRGAAENADDGYRVEPTFPTVPFSTVKMRLPFEVTEDEYEQNIEKRALEAKLVRRFSTQLGLDLDDLNISGDTAAGAGPDQAFLQLDDGLVKLITTDVATAHPDHVIDGSTINGGAMAKEHLFAANFKMPNKYRSGKLRWLMSPNRRLSWVEYLANRGTPAGDAALSGTGTGITDPLSIPALEVPFLPDSLIVLTDPKNIVRVYFNQVKRYIVGPNTDWELATRDKNGYIFFVRQDLIIEETDAIVAVTTLDPPA